MRAAPQRQAAERGDSWRERREQRAARGLARMRRADDDFEPVRVAALRVGLVLERKAFGHFHLSPVAGPRWLLNLYPSNCRIYADPAQPAIAPFVNLVRHGRGPGWALRDVVNAAAAAKAQR